MQITGKCWAWRVVGWRKIWRSKQARRWIIGFVRRRIAFNEYAGTKNFFDILSKNVQICLVKKYRMTFWFLDPFSISHLRCQHIRRNPKIFLFHLWAPPSIFLLRKDQRRRKKRPRLFFCRCHGLRWLDAAIVTTSGACEVSRSVLASKENERTYRRVVSKFANSALSFERKKVYGT